MKSFLLYVNGQVILGCWVWVKEVFIMIKQNRMNFTYLKTAERGDKK